MKKVSLFTLLYCFTCLSLLAQKKGPQSLADLKESPAGMKTLLFLETINNGEKIEAANIEALFSKRLVDKLSAEVLKNYLLDIRQQDGQMALYDAIRSSMFEYDFKVLSLANDGWLDLNLKIEANPPYKIDGFGIQTSDLAAMAETPIYSPNKPVSFEPKEVDYAENQEIAEKADAIAKEFEELGWFSGSILIAKDQKPFFEKAYGYADIENKIPNTAETKFRIGSINKSFTDILIHQMVEKGALSYTDKLSKFDLGFDKAVAEKINLKQIMTHTAGFADIFIPKYLNNIRDYKDIDDILPLLLNEPLIYEPGKGEEYSNYGYIVLGAILEKTTGEKFGDLIQKNILDPLGMKDTHYDIAEHIEGEAKSYRFTVTGEKVDHTGGLEYCTPDGGMYSTTGNLLKFFNAWFYSEKLISNQTKAYTMSGYKKPKRTWEKIINSKGGGIGDAGGGPGVSATVEIEFGIHYTIIVLANTDVGIAEEVGLRIRSALRGRKYEKANLPPANFVWTVMEEKGSNYLIENFKDVLKEGGYHEAHSGFMNRIGYSLIYSGDLDKAIEVFKTNVEIFPKEANPYDSLAEAYYKKGDKAAALKYYQKALEIDPDLPSAKRMVKELKKS